VSDIRTAAPSSCLPPELCPDIFSAHPFLMWSDWRSRGLHAVSGVGGWTGRSGVGESWELSGVAEYVHGGDVIVLAVQHPG